MRLQPTNSVLDIARRLEEAGFEAWCVGGAIRDALLGGHPLDWDIATSARPEEVQALFGRRKTIPVGIEFGTVCVLDAAGVGHEITTFRRDVQTDGRHAVVEFGASLDDDLARRDFTINAIAFRPKTDELRDPFDGRGDIERRIVRAVGVADDRLREDRLRALRAIRFAARYGFTIEPETLQAIRASAPHLTRLSAERVQQELVKTMQQVERPSQAMNVWRDTGALGVLVPVLRGGSFDMLDHLARDTSGRPVAQRTSNRIAALFLDVTEKEARDALMALKFSKHEIRWTGELVRAWRALADDVLQGLGKDVPDEAVRRWVAAIGRLQTPAFFRLFAARVKATEGTARMPRVAALYRRALHVRFRDPIEIGDLAIGGDELRAAGIHPGPLYAKILTGLLERVLVDPARNTPTQLLSDARELAASARENAGGDT
jgi:tRNA nucleotidyltransferase (CCA-adding enzyme)